MSQSEWVILVKALKCAFPENNFLADDYSVKLWYTMLKDIPYRVVNIAVNKYIQTEHFPPKVADIRKIVTEMLQPEIADWSKGWEEVLNAIRFYGFYRHDEALASMSEVTRECVKRLGWKEICLSENINQDRANFRMAYEQIAERKRKESVLTPNLLEEIRNRQALLPNGEEAKLIGEVEAT